MERNREVGIIGLGRFGQLWASLLKSDFQVRVYDPGEGSAARAQAIGIELSPLHETLCAETIFYCVPISALENTLLEHGPHFAQLGGSKTLIDVLSVKLHPLQLMAKYLPAGYQALLTHPMFGPDSVRSDGLANKPIVLDGSLIDDERYIAWKEYFVSKGLSVVEISADDHDRLAASSQGLTHFVGRILGEFGLEPTAIDILGATKLHEIKRQVCNDSWQLFVDLQTYNPYTRAMRVKLAAAQEKVFNKLLPNRIYKDRLVVGIQGGRGSFNEEAARYYMSRTPEVEYELQYLHTTENVLAALHEGIVDRGQFAIHNSLGGVVTESIHAMSKFNCEILEEFAIKIAHSLMIASDADFSQIDTIMTHPQVLRQCRTNLDNKYKNLKQMSGEGEMVDHAKVAECISQRLLPKNIATMGSNVLAQIHGLKVVENNLQDLDTNFTSFLWVQRPS